MVSRPLTRARLVLWRPPGRESLGKVPGGWTVPGSGTSSKRDARAGDLHAHGVPTACVVSACPRRGLLRGNRLGARGAGRGVRGLVLVEADALGADRDALARRRRADLVRILAVGREDHGSAAAHHAEVLLDLADHEELALDAVHDLQAQFLVGHLAPAVLEAELDLVPFLEELAGVVDLDHQVMLIDLGRADLDLLEAGVPLGGPLLVFLLLLLVLPLAVVEDLADRRADIRSD